MMESLNALVESADNFLWGKLLVFLLVGTGIYLSFRMRGIQIFGLRHGIRLTRGLYDQKEDQGDLSHFQALSTALAATVGVGNIAGVAIAIRLGGPGALFWMWVTAAVGMATKFTSCTLALKYREINPDGSVSGGPMYFIEHGLGPKWKWLAVAFAALAALASFGAGCMAQAGELTRAFMSLVPGLSHPIAGTGIDLGQMGVGILVAVMVGVVIIGGIHRIGEVASRLVPLMAIFYVGAGIIILLMNVTELPQAVYLIVHDAFTGTAAAGGFTGSFFLYTMQMGVRRGLFSNESGQGSAPIAHATAKTQYPVREGYVALLEPFIDTIIICSITGLVIVVTGAWTETSGIGGADLTAFAFQAGLADLHNIAAQARLGRVIVTIGVILFAYSTAISWSYYGDRCVGYLFGLKAIKPYRYVFCVFLVVGATIKIDLVWNLCDVMNGGMAIPNLIALILLSGVVWNELKGYRARIPEFDRALAAQSSAKEGSS
ncbi:MAG TPA: sodium:alanine symporter family protein [bacterium]|nr:sodium:alanine symporter family protein [bacterium]